MICGCNNPLRLAGALPSIFLLVTGHCLAMEMYVAIDGHDSHSGTSSAPFATIVRVQEAVRTLKYTCQYPDDGVTVVLRGGRYELKEPLWFTPIDSGKEGAPVIYTAAEEEEVILSGGRVITGWTEHQDGIWKAPAKGLFRQLYVNGQRAVRARSPNGTDDFSRLIEWDRDTQTAVVPTGAVAQLSDPGNAEFIVQIVWE